MVYQCSYASISDIVMNMCCIAATSCDPTLGHRPKHHGVEEQAFESSRLASKGKLKLETQESVCCEPWLSANKRQSQSGRWKQYTNQTREPEIKQKRRRQEGGMRSHGPKRERERDRGGESERYSEREVNKGTHPKQ